MKLKTSQLEIDVREGTVDDVPLLLSFIQAMAEFEKLEVAANEELLRGSLFGARPAAHVLLAFANGKPAAYAAYCFNFSTMLGKRGLWLEDIFVHPEFRRKGIGKALMAYLADIAVKQQCGRFEWIVLDWNKTAIEVYEGLGANILDEWRICRLGDRKLAGLAREIHTLTRD